MDIAAKTNIAEIKTIIAEIKADIAELKREMVKTQWMLGLLFVSDTAIFVKVFF